MVKTCGHCHQRKGPTAFWSDRRKPDGLDATCRACRHGMRRGGHRRKPDPPPDPREGWCPNCTAGRHGRACTAAFFGPDCACGCGILGYRGLFGYCDPTAISWDVGDPDDMMEGVG